MKSKNIKTLLLLSGFAALTLHLANKFIFTVSTLKDLLNTDKGHYYSWRLGRVYYTVQGSGTPVLLIHDLHAAGSSYEWHRLAEQLAKTNTVYTLDLLGCGSSEKPNLTYTNYLYVQLITDFIKNVIKHPAHVAASGMSGSFTIMACHNAPELFQKLLLINPVSLKKLNKSPSKRTKTLKWLIDCPIIGTAVYNALVTREMIQKDFIENWFYDPCLVSDRDIDAYVEAAHKQGACAKFLLSSLKGNLININIIHALKEINNSIYILAGAQAEDMSEIVSEYTSYNLAIESCYLEHTRLLPQLETPEALCEQMRIFLE